MSYAKRLETDIRNEAYQTAPDRVTMLEQRLKTLSSGFGTPEMLQQAWSDLLYLERLIAAEVRSIPALKLRRDLQEHLPSMRSRLEAIKETTNFPESPPTSTSLTGVRADSGGLGDLVSSAGSRSRSGISATSRQGKRGESKTGIQAVSEFLLSTSSPNDEDEVRLLAAEGRLGLRLGENPTLSIGKKSAGELMMFKAWTEDDEAEETRRERRLILELREGVAALHEVTETLALSVEAANEPLRQAEEQVASARAEVQLAVGALKEGTKSEYCRRAILFFVIAVVLGVGAFASWEWDWVVTCSALFVVCIILIACSFSSWRQKMIVHMQHQLPRAFKPVPPREAEHLEERGEEAVHRLRQALDDSSWEHRRSLTFLSTRMALARRKSSVREGGHAYRISFTVPMSARRVYQIFRKGNAAGSLDSLCRSTWVRPLDMKTSVRYVIMSNWLVERDFFMVAGAEEARDPDGVHIVAQMSLDTDDLHGSFMPIPDGSDRHGYVKCMGIRVCGCNSSKNSAGARVELVADLDPHVNCCLRRSLSDMDIKVHMFTVARALLKELNAEEGISVWHTSGRRLEAVQLESGVHIWSDRRISCHNHPPELKGAFLYRHSFRGLPQGTAKVYAPEGATVYVFSTRSSSSSSHDPENAERDQGPSALGWAVGPAGFTVDMGPGRAMAELQIWQREVLPGETLAWPTFSCGGCGIAIAAGQEAVTKRISRPSAATAAGAGAEAPQRQQHPAAA